MAPTKSVLVPKLHLQRTISTCPTKSLRSKTDCTQRCILGGAASLMFGYGYGSIEGQVKLPAPSVVVPCSMHHKTITLHRTFDLHFTYPYFSLHIRRFSTFSGLAFFGINP